jgi:hypothetical protein
MWNKPFSLTCYYSAVAHAAALFQAGNDCAVCTISTHSSRNFMLLATVSSQSFGKICDPHAAGSEENWLFEWN